MSTYLMRGPPAHRVIFNGVFFFNTKTFIDNHKTKYKVQGRFSMELRSAFFLHAPHSLANLKSATPCNPFSYTSSCSGMYHPCPCEEELSAC